MEEGALNSAAKREMLLNKAAAKDPKLQRRLIISGINKDIYRSILFRHMFISRRHRITPEEISRRPTIQGMLEIIKDEEKEEGEDEEDEEEDDEDDDEPIRDEFLDLPFDCKIEVLKAKKKAVNSKRNFI